MDGSFRSFDILEIFILHISYPFADGYSAITYDVELGNGMGELICMRGDPAIPYPYPMVPSSLP